MVTIYNSIFRFATASLSFVAGDSLGSNDNEVHVVCALALVRAAEVRILGIIQRQRQVICESFGSCPAGVLRLDSWR